MCHLKHRLRIFIFRRKIMFRSHQDIQVFVFLTIPWFTKPVTSQWVQPWELGKKYNSNFIFTFAVVKVRYGGITTAKIFKHGNYLKYLFLFCFLLLDCYIESLWRTRRNHAETILTICKLNKIMCNSKICTSFNVCMKDKKHSRKLNYLPYLVDKCL